MKKLILAQFGACSEISAGVLNDCDNPPVGGADDRLIIYNFDDIESYTYNVTDPRIIESIVMKADKVGYVFEGKQQSNEPKQTLVKKKYNSSWDHEVTFKIFSGTPIAKAQVEKMKDGKFIALIQNNYQGVAGNGAFELYGKATGLYLEASDRNIADTELLVAFNMVLKSSELYKEPLLPNTVFVTSLAATKIMVDGTITP